jgi:hypothetical protein
MQKISETESPGDNRSGQSLKITGTAENRSLGEKIAAKRARRLATTPESAKGHFVAAWAGKCSPRRAIKALCLECVSFDRQAITDCLCWACPLWHFRPFQKP